MEKENLIRVSLSVIWHSIATATRLDSEIAQEQAAAITERESIILEGSGHPAIVPVLPELIPFYRIRTWGIAASLCVMAILTSYGTWLAAKPKMATTLINPTIDWATPDPIIEGARLSDKQLDAKISIPGKLVYTPDIGAILPAGTHTLTLKFTPTDQTKYASADASVYLTVNPAPTPTPQSKKSFASTERVVRVTGFAIDQLTVGVPIQLRLSYANDHTETVNVMGYFCGGIVDHLPDPSNADKLLELEDAIWTCVLDKTRKLKGLSNPAPAKAIMQVPDTLRDFVVTNELIEKINGDGGIYIAGLLKDTSGKYLPTSYCVLIDKNRTGQSPTLCHGHN